MPDRKLIQTLRPWRISGAFIILPVGLSILIMVIQILGFIFFGFYVLILFILAISFFALFWGVKEVKEVSERNFAKGIFRNETMQTGILFIFIAVFWVGLP